MLLSEHNIMFMFYSRYNNKNKICLEKEETEVDPMMFHLKRKGSELKMSIYLLCRLSIISP